MFFWKIKKRFGFWSNGSKVSILTSADASGLTVWSTNVGIHKIDGPTFKLFGKVQVEDKLGRDLFICEKKLLVADTNRKGWSFGLFGATSALQGGLTARVIYQVV